MVVTVQIQNLDFDSDSGSKSKTLKSPIKDSGRTEITTLRDATHPKFTNEFKTGVLSFAKSFAYVDNPRIVFKHPSANFYLSCTSDYNYSIEILTDNAQTNIFPVYTPKLVLGDRKFDVDIITSLTVKYMKYADVNGIPWKYRAKTLNWVPPLSLMPDISNSRRLLAIKFLVLTFVLDDPLEEMVGYKEVFEPYIQNILNISTDSSDYSILDLRKCPIQVACLAKAIETAVVAQDGLAELMVEFKANLPPKVYKLFCKMNREYFSSLKVELELWSAKLEQNKMVTYKERATSKSYSYGLINVLCTILVDEDADFFPVESEICKLVNLAGVEENDIFSYFKEQDEEPLNIFNILCIHQYQGLNRFTAFHEAVKRRNELIRKIEIIVQSKSGIEAKALSKGLLILLASTHFHFNSERYGWIPVQQN